ncbi:hypothetical protein [Comamonas sp. F1-6]|uniref:phage head spike fiber domain-containing protein n=1 Tax=Comamonas sp. F1-6 TaxID=673550 RepID=UPI0031DE855E
MTTITDFPGIRPSLLLDFANSGRVDPRISCVRASTATCFAPDGKLRTVANNAPRIDFDLASGACQGLLVEETRTNLLTYAADMSQGWVKGSAAQWSVGTGFNGSGNHVRVLGLRNYSISPDAACIYNTSVPVVAGTRHVFSMYLRLLPDSPSNRVMLRVRQSDGSNIYSPPLILTDRWARYSLALTIGEGITFVAAIFGTPGDTDVVNCEIACGQFEQGEFATSFIPTISTAVTRAADLLHIDHTLPPVGAVVASVAGLALANTANAYIWSAHNPADTNADHAYAYFSGSNNRTNWWVNKGGVGQSGGNIAGRPLGIGMSFDATGKAAALAAGSLITKDTTRPRDFPANLSQLRLGRSISNNGFLGGCISRLAVYSGRITDAQLQRLTA